MKLACLGEPYDRKSLRGAPIFQAAERNLPKSFCYGERRASHDKRHSYARGKNVPNQTNETNNTKPLLMIRWQRAVRLKVKPVNLSVLIPQQHANLAEFAVIVKEHFRAKSFHANHDK
jgi:hypothetical protein